MGRDSNAATTSAGPGAAPGTGREVGGCSRALLFFMLFGLMSLPVVFYFTGGAGKVKRGVIEIIEATREQPDQVTRFVTEKVVVEKIVEVPAPPEPLPDDYVERKVIDTAELYSGLQLRSVLDVKKGRRATVEREDPDSYEILLSLNVKAPVATQKLQEFAELNPDLPKMIPALGLLLEGSRVSGFFHKLYEIKAKRLQTYITRLDRVLSRHN
ncbi:MAG: hypothetical protein ACC661_11125, partial [Verrucomicrobiales bacterium]